MSSLLTKSTTFFFKSNLFLTNQFLIIENLFGPKLFFNQIFFLRSQTFFCPTFVRTRKKVWVKKSSNELKNYSSLTKNNLSTISALFKPFPLKLKYLSFFMFKEKNNMIMNLIRKIFCPKTLWQKRFLNKKIHFW